MLMNFEAPGTKTSTRLEKCKRYVSALMLGFFNMSEIQSEDLENALKFQWYLAKDACRSLFKKLSKTKESQSAD